MQTGSRRHNLFVFLRAQLSAQFATLADFMLTYICFQWLGMYYLLATAIGTTSGGIINCFINYKWAFKTEDCKLKWVFLKYALVWTGSFFLNVGGLYLLVEFLKSHTYLWDNASGFSLIASKIVVSFIVSIGWNYTLHRYFVFRNVNIKQRAKSLFYKNENNEH